MQEHFLSLFEEKSGVEFREFREPEIVGYVYSIGFERLDQTLDQEARNEHFDFVGKYGDIFLVLFQNIGH